MKKENCRKVREDDDRRGRRDVIMRGEGLSERGQQHTSCVFCAKCVAGQYGSDCSEFREIKLPGSKFRKTASVNLEKIITMQCSIIDGYPVGVCAQIILLDETNHDTREKRNANFSAHIWHAIFGRI